MTTPVPQPGIMTISPYVGGKSKAGENLNVAKLSSNESPLGPSPKAVAAIEAAAKNAHRYPDGGSLLLTEAIAEVHKLDPAKIVCGNGSDELISLLNTAYVGPGDEVLFPEHGFLMYAISAAVAGATHGEGARGEPHGKC